jgi:hypothetical protein
MARDKGSLVIDTTKRSTETAKVALPAIPALPDAASGTLFSAFKPSEDLKPAGDDVDDFVEIQSATF